VIQISGTDVGIMAIDRQPDCVKVHQINILPEHQSRGIGTECMKHIIEDAATLRLPVRLQVLKVNSRAMSFYEKLGFKSTSESETHFLLERQP